MLNRYPWWKYIILVITIIISLLYALPNLYAEDPAVQITGLYSKALSEPTIVQVKQILEKEKITNKSITLEKGIILVRFNTANIQLRARETLMNELGNKYIIACNFVPSIPYWLSILHAQPIKLGLDLRGGVHFLIEVDIDAALYRLQEQKIEELCLDLQAEGINYITTRKANNYGVHIIFHNSSTCNQAVNYLTLRHREFVFSLRGKNQLYGMITESYLKKAQVDSIQKNIYILRNRINQLGILEPLVYQQGANKIVVEIPGIQDAAYAKEILGATATLEFRLVNLNLNLSDIAVDRIPNYLEIKKTRTGQPVLLYKRAILTGDHITDAIFSQNEYNQPQVNISLDSVGGKIMSHFTKENINKLMAILLVEFKNDNQQNSNSFPLSSQREEIINIAEIQSHLSNNFRITGINSAHEARQLALLLRSGSLTAPIKIIEERTTGPTLGRENIRKFSEACLAGLLVSMIFIVLCYKKFGLIASVALIINLILITGTMSLLSCTILTMSGIAGILLTLSTAVDASVVINERIKEEIKNGYSIQQAINRGYKGAFASIFDANATTLINVLILYIVGTGAIESFAITTGIGVMTSMFTTIFATRAIINLLYGRKYLKKLSI